MGVSDHTICPPEALLKEKIGSWTHPNRERLLVLKPDLILTQGRHETLRFLCKGVWHKALRRAAGHAK